MIFSQKQNMNPEPLLLTMTGESYQPARIYYQVNQKNAVIGRFRRLRCIDYDSSQNRWVWSYSEEAKKIQFTKSYRDIPKEYRPLVLGYFTWEGEKILRLDVRSFERVIEAITFFDKKINRRLAQVTKIKIVNKLFPATMSPEEISNHHRIFFDERQAVNPTEKMEKLKDIFSQYEAPEEGREAVFSYLRSEMKKTLPEVEELEVHFYEDGIESIVMSLKMRQLEAMEHWKGNTNFSQFDVMETFLENFEQEEF